MGKSERERGQGPGWGMVVRGALLRRGPKGNRTEKVTCEGGWGPVMLIITSLLFQEERKQTQGR